MKPGDANGWNATTGMEIALLGLCNQARFRLLLRSLTAFEEGTDGHAKRIAKPHPAAATAGCIVRWRCRLDHSFS